MCLSPSAAFAMPQGLSGTAVRSAAPPILLVSQKERLQYASPGLATSGPMELWRAPDGLFYVAGTINGHMVRFLVDTGASMIVLTSQDAQRVGAIADPGSVAIRTETANGDSHMTRVTLASMQVGATGASAIPAAVASDGLKISLLGQNWLSHIGSVRIEGDRMILD